MHKKIVYILFASLLLTSCGKERVANDLKNSFMRFYGGQLTNEGYDVKQLPDGSYIALGTTETATNSYQMYLLKVDAYGKKKWQKEFGGKGNDQGYSLQVMPDGGYILAGSSDTNNISNIYLVRTDSKGNMIWEQRLGGNISQRAYCIQLASQGGFVLAGSRDFTTGTIAMIVFTDSLGNTKYSYHANNQETYSGEAKYVTELKDGSFLFTGYSDYVVPDDDSLTLSNVLVGRVRYKNDLWSSVRCFGGLGNDYGECIKQLPDESFVCVGTKYISGDSLTNIFVLKLKLNIDGFNSDWQISFGDKYNDLGKSIEIISNDEFAVVGTKGNFDESQDIYILKINGSGKVLNEKDNNTIGGVYDQRGNCIVKTSDGGFIITGTNEYTTTSVLSLIKAKSEDEL